MHCNAKRQEKKRERRKRIPNFTAKGGKAGKGKVLANTPLIN